MRDEIEKKRKGEEEVISEGESEESSGRVGSCRAGKRLKFEAKDNGMVPCLCVHKCVIERMRLYEVSERERERDMRRVGNSLSLSVCL